MTTRLMKYFNRQPRIGTMSTAGTDGKVDVAVYGSPQMTDDKTVVVGSGENRTLANLRENPLAVYIIIEPGQFFFDWEGVRVYLTLKAIAASGSAFEGYMAMLATVAGEAAASMIKALLTFEVTEVRPIVDMGQAGKGRSEPRWCEHGYRRPVWRWRHCPVFILGGSGGPPESYPVESRTASQSKSARPAGVSGK